MRNDTVRTTFTRWALYYDATHAWTLPYRRRARLALGIQPGDHVLNLACGTGLSFRHLRDLVGAPGQVTGVDLTPAMLDIARARIARRGWANVAVREADAADLAKAPDVAGIERCIGACSSLSLLINNAGFGTLGGFAESDLEEQLAMIRVHIDASVRLTRAALPGILASGRGALSTLRRLVRFCRRRTTSRTMRPISTSAWWRPLLRL